VPLYIFCRLPSRASILLLSPPISCLCLFPPSPASSTPMSSYLSSLSILSLPLAYFYLLRLFNLTFFTYKFLAFCTVIGHQKQKNATVLNA
jgi:hypothetical protein